MLRLSRNTLLMNLRFMDAALHQLTPLPFEKTTLATDGNWLLYSPFHVLRCFKSAREIPVRDYLHVIFHCVFRHMYVHTQADRVCWDLACDIAVEHTISELGIRAAAASRERLQKAEFDRLKQAVGQMTAETLYRCFLDAGLSKAQLADLRGLFYADDHALWYMTEPELRALGVPKPSSRRRVPARTKGKKQAEARRFTGRSAGRSCPTGCRWRWRTSSSSRETGPGA